jgi:DNA repair exonuclease SbcCD ATPase subunit
MEAAHITWRPLGQLFVERGLISQEELEDALVEQRETSKRLGTILVSRGLVSGPELTSVLVDQLGMELTKESGFGSGLWDEIRRRHPRGRERIDAGPTPPAQPVEPAAPSEEFPPVPVADAPAPLAPVYRAPVVEEPLPDLAKLEADLAKERAALAAAAAEERAELQAVLDQERSVLQAAIEHERAGRQQALEELLQARADASTRAVELGQLGRQVEELRAQLEQSSHTTAAEQEAREQMEQLEGRVSALEASLAAERLAHLQAVGELDHARSEAGAEAKELRSSIDRMRIELERLDAATSWFEYWSGATPAASPRGEHTEAG